MASSTSATVKTTTTWSPYARLAVPALSALPLHGIANPGQSILEARRLLTATVTVLDQIRDNADGVDALARTALDNARFHALVGLSQINYYQRLGYTVYDNVMAVPGLWEAMENHVVAVAKAQAISSSGEEKAPAKPTAAKAAAAVGFGAGDPFSTISEAALAPNIYSLLGLGVVAAGVLAAWYILSPPKL